MLEALRQEALNLIEAIPYLTLSPASKDGHPWCSPVNCAYDDKFNFYWASAKALKLLRKRSNNPDKYYPLDYYSELRDIRVYQFTPTEFSMLHPEGDKRFTAYAACRVHIDLND